MILWTLALALASQAKADPTERFTLENGLTAILRPMKGADKTAVVVLFSIGGDHDPEGCSGLAHLTEHLYVTAAAGEAKARTVAEVFQRYPGGHNAQTGERYTVVASVVPRASQEAELRDAAARMGALRIEAADLDRERPRVLEEVENMFGRIPELGVRNLAGEAIRPTPREGRRGGRPDQVASFALEPIRAHWKRYYKPRNALVVVAGACDPKETREWIRAYFAALPSGDPPPEPGAPGTPRPGSVAAKEVKPLVAGSPSYVSLAYPAPAPGSDLYAPFLVLAVRLWSQASKIGAGPGRFPVAFAPLDDPSKLTVGAPLGKDETREQAVKRLDDFVFDAVKAELKAGDVQATLQMMGFLLGLSDLPDGALAQNPYGVAFMLGRSHQLGLDREKLRAKLSTLKAEDLRRAGKEFFSADRRAAAAVIVKE